jgi:acyl carrier protein phosphodiesterase
MNFLAHVFLSGDDEALLVGNFIADFVKGRRKDDYPERIRQGIELHRRIDDFTDHHPIPAASRRRLQPAQGKYAGVVVDLFYDHFLARHFMEYSTVPLDIYSMQVYRVVQSYADWLPEGVRAFLPYMIENNWLLNYASMQGIGRTLGGLSRRVAYENRMHRAGEDLLAGYAGYEAEFRQFFPKLTAFVATQLSA